jgi:hypothetical protein
VKRLLYVLLLLSCSGVCAQTASLAISGRVTDQYGNPVPFAQIRVCPATSSGTPCSPTTPIYKDYALSQQVANPTSADQYGNYTVYAPQLASPNLYTIQESVTNGLTWNYVRNGPSVCDQPGGCTGGPAPPAFAVQAANSSATALTADSAITINPTNHSFSVAQGTITNSSYATPGFSITRNDTSPPVANGYTNLFLAPMKSEALRSDSGGVTGAQTIDYMALGYQCAPGDCSSHPINGQMIAFTSADIIHSSSPQTITVTNSNLSCPTNVFQYSLTAGGPNVSPVPVTVQMGVWDGNTIQTEYTSVTVLNCTQVSGVFNISHPAGSKIEVYGLGYKAGLVISGWDATTNQDSMYLENPNLVANSSAPDQYTAMEIDAADNFGHDAGRFAGDTYPLVNGLELISASNNNPVLGNPTMGLQIADASTGVQWQYGEAISSGKYYGSVVIPSGNGKSGYGYGVVNATNAGFIVGANQSSPLFGYFPGNVPGNPPYGFEAVAECTSGSCPSENFAMQSLVSGSPAYSQMNTDSLGWINLQTTQHGAMEPSVVITNDGRMLVQYWDGTSEQPGRYQTSFTTNSGSGQYASTPAPNIMTTANAAGTGSPDVNLVGIDSGNNYEQLNAGNYAPGVELDGAVTFPSLSPNTSALCYTGSPAVVTNIGCTSGAPVRGTVVLSSGVATIAAASACLPGSNCVYKLSNCGTNGSSTLGIPSVNNGTVIVGTSFEIESLNPSTGALVTGDQSVICYQLN